MVGVDSTIAPKDRVWTINNNGTGMKEGKAKSRETWTENSVLETRTEKQKKDEKKRAEDRKILN